MSRRGARGRGRVRLLLFAALAVGAVGLVPASLSAFETDQFLTLDLELEDSAAALNGYVNGEIELVLARVNGGSRLRTCEELPPRIFRRLFAHLLSSRLKHFLEHSPEVDRHPGDGIGYWQYLERSIYRKPIFPYIMPMSSSVNVGGVYLGIDKFGHMMGEGRRYYKHFLRARSRGLDEEEAVRQVVLRRQRWERVVLGGLSNGVVSLADLEGNYQGLRLARAMCEGPRPHLVRRVGAWQLDRAVHMEDYVVPALDESFNLNRFPRRRWKKVRPILLAEHCPKLEHPVWKARLQHYRTVEVTSPSQRVLERHFHERGIMMNQYSLTTLCRDSDGRWAAESGATTRTRPTQPRP